MEGGNLWTNTTLLWSQSEDLVSHLDCEVLVFSVSQSGQMVVVRVNIKFQIGENQFLSEQ